MSCNFDEVMMCSGHERNVVISIVITYIFYLFISTILSSVGIRGLNIVLWLMIPAIGMWLAYGMSPLCSPMLPTCLIQDVISSVQIILPSRIVWPSSLQAYPGCIGPTKGEILSAIESGYPVPNVSSLPMIDGIDRGSKGCMLSCRDDPFNFRSWESSLSWIVCGIDPIGCRNLDIPYFPSFRGSIVNHTMVLNSTSEDAIDLMESFNLCFWLTIAQSIPYMFLMIAMAIASLFVLQLPIIIVAAGTQFLMQAFAYTHSG